MSHSTVCQSSDILERH